MRSDSIVQAVADEGECVYQYHECIDIAVVYTWLLDVSGVYKKISKTDLEQLVDMLT